MLVWMPYKWTKCLLCNWMISAYTFKYVFCLGYTCNDKHFLCFLIQIRQVLFQQDIYKIFRLTFYSEKKFSIKFKRKYFIGSKAIWNIFFYDNWEASFPINYSLLLIFERVNSFRCSVTPLNIPFNQILDKNHHFSPIFVLIQYFYFLHIKSQNT